MSILREVLARRFDDVRAQTIALAAPLGVDEQLAQAFPDASPTKWHLAHTTWFFERFVLREHAPGYEPVDPRYDYLFNSYYEAVGDRQPRAERSLIVRPTLPEVHAYRARVDEAMRRLLGAAPREEYDRSAHAIELGTHHEEQHQELLLTDVKPLLAGSPMHLGHGAARPSDAPGATASAPTWIARDGGLVEIGCPPPSSRDSAGFAFDNESPRHRVFLEPFELASRCVTAREYLAFVDDGGYTRPELWLSDGWTTVREQGWSAPLYWRRGDAGWREHTLRGREPLALDAPVCHVSFFEADAFARWAGARLPTEAEWETIASERLAAGGRIEGNFVESRALHPLPATGSGATQLFGDAWEWTSSAYAPYPRYSPFAGAFAEYNGKFMCSQMVLRGGSCLSPAAHLRATYRNFFPPSARWQMSGIRLARWS
ncbi:MAG: ergothioneine biosynthesis protein EgtB [Myxococcota bacterium]|nr:ergothioneine biosynthesis protein EgtB [Myxococcota bacterium]